MVERIKQLPAELYSITLTNLPVLHEREIRGSDSWTAQEVFAQVTESALRVSHKGSGVHIMRQPLSLPPDVNLPTLSEEQCVVTAIIVFIPFF
jgi:hypothetical protein